MELFGGSVVVVLVDVLVVVEPGVVLVVVIRKPHGVHAVSHDASVPLYAGYWHEHGEQLLIVTFHTVPFHAHLQAEHGPGVVEVPVVDVVPDGNGTCLAQAV